MKFVNICGIYCIENLVNGKLYIGQSTNIRLRWNLHRSRLNRCVLENPHLQSAWTKYGESSFRLIVLEECTFDLLDQREVYWISQLGTTDRSLGYNINSGGHANKSVSAETREKLRIANLGANNPGFGKKRSEETRLKMSLAATGENNYHYGKKYTEEEKLKLYGSRRGKRANKEKTPCVLA